jgi:hypothetical protein
MGRGSSTFEAVTVVNVEGVGSAPIVGLNGAASLVAGRVTALVGSSGLR